MLPECALVSIDPRILSSLLFALQLCFSYKMQISFCLIGPSFFMQTEASGGPSRSARRAEVMQNAPQRSAKVDKLQHSFFFCFPSLRTHFLKVGAASVWQLLQTFVDLV